MVKEKIEDLREILYRAIQDKNNMDYEKVLQISQDMDKYIYAYMKNERIKKEVKHLYT